MGEQIKLEFEREKETKNTVRYTELEREDGPKLVGTLYLQKFAAKKFGDNITVTIEGK